ncbi:hypothetical protein tb265_18980 [Gemmatimonadetes bacterium T265]|nr:hypothetical protein tb265_18980 [Gemmatimonadetes bacterium T265]
MVTVRYLARSVDAAGQFCDKGEQYTAAIFYRNGTQRRDAEASADARVRSGRFLGPLATRLLPAAPFYPAEDYHQGYARKNPVRYHFHRWTCGRDRRLAQLRDAVAAATASAGPGGVPNGSRR